MGRKDISVVLTGNKSDLKDERQVTFLEASRFAQENDALFLETSALTGENVEEVFLKAARSVLSKIESGVIDPKSMVSGGLRPDPSQEDTNGVSVVVVCVCKSMTMVCD
jgi:Ras-related protein Rab-4B|tara:strand:- start:33 stop:359 length:327 start_codon:yes stop_codon:yes gene_type:complete